MKPMRQVQNIFYYRCLILYIKIHNYIVNMKTDLVTLFQHSLLNREVFIQVHGHFQTEESHKKNQIGNCICIASYQPALS